MLKKIKAAKRRTVQRNLERMGKAEGIKDPEYDEALKNFKDVEEKLSKMQSLLKDSLSVSKQFTARQAALGSHVAASLLAIWAANCLYLPMLRTWPKRTPICTAR